MQFNKCYVVTLTAFPRQAMMFTQTSDSKKILMRAGAARIISDIRHHGRLLASRVRNQPELYERETRDDSVAVASSHDQWAVRAAHLDGQVATP